MVDEIGEFVDDVGEFELGIIVEGEVGVGCCCSLCFGVLGGEVFGCWLIEE